MLTSRQVLGWQTALCSTAYSAALAVQGIIALTTSNYSVPAWHGVLLTVGIVLFSLLFSQSKNLTMVSVIFLILDRYRPDPQTPHSSNI